ncbi:MAG: hypothetical protein CMM61_17390 [Rhodospirillaceae bacterium]|nr:hypothetical protein [Rhodospirillaceae bacterium]
MPYVVRDGEGNVRAVFDTPVEGAEEVAPDDPGLAAFVNQNAQTGMVLDEWVESDLALVRVVEDVVEVLIDKGVFMFNELPAGAQKKLNTRRGRRKEMDLMESLFGEMALPEDEDPSGGQGSGGGQSSGGGDSIL